ncbi:hypothetical protein ACOME3_000671 [Neoechinorhynchus agilis]
MTWINLTKSMHTQLFASVHGVSKTPKYRSKSKTFVSTVEISQLNNNLNDNMRLRNQSTIHQIRQKEYPNVARSIVKLTFCSNTAVSGNRLKFQIRVRGSYCKNEL